MRVLVSVPLSLLTNLNAADPTTIGLVLVVIAAIVLYTVVKLLEVIAAIARTALVFGAVLLVLSVLVSGNDERSDPPRAPPSPSPVGSSNACNDRTQPGPCAAVPVPSPLPSPTPCPTPTPMPSPSPSPG